MIVNLSIGFVLFILFGYLEKTLSLGWLVSAGLICHALLVSQSLKLLSTRTLSLAVLFALQLSLADKSAYPALHDFRFTDDMFQFYERQRLGTGVFLAIVWVCFGAKNQWEEVHVDFAPHEQVLRKFLLEYDPSLLFKVGDVNVLTVDNMCVLMIFVI